MSDKPWGSCDPNSQHQTWGRWTFQVAAYVPLLLQPNFAAMQAECQRWFGRLTRGSAAELHIAQLGSPSSPGLLRYTVTLRWDRRDALDAAYQERIRALFEGFLRGGIGATVTVTLRPVVIEAGDAEDGHAPAQLLVLPVLSDTTRLHGV